MGLIQRDQIKLRREEVRGGRRREVTANGGGGMQWQENHWPSRSKLVAKLLRFNIILIAINFKCANNAHGFSRKYFPLVS